MVTLRPARLRHPHRLPAASVPFGSDQGLPLGLQIVAPAGGEQTVLALAAEIERLRP
jgi:amidase